MKFRKKPVVIEATQWNKDGDHPNVVSLPPKVGETMEERAMGWDPMQYRWIGTLEGGHIVSPGDWIITGVQAEQYPCKPDIFAATYEPVDAAAGASPAAHVPETDCGNIEAVQPNSCAYCTHPLFVGLKCKHCGRVVQRALDALEHHVAQTRPIEKTSQAIVELRAAIAAPEVEPVAWFEHNESLDAWFLAYSFNPKVRTRPLYTAAAPVNCHPGSPGWPIALRDSTIDAITDGCFQAVGYQGTTALMRAVARAVERQHGIFSGEGQT